MQDDLAQPETLGDLPGVPAAAFTRTAQSARPAPRSAAGAPLFPTGRSRPAGQTRTLGPLPAGALPGQRRDSGDDGQRDTEGDQQAAGDQSGVTDCTLLPPELITV